jgi:hypothetical protein
MTATWRDQTEPGAMTFVLRPRASARTGSTFAQCITTTVHRVRAAAPSWQLTPIEISRRV